MSENSLLRRPPVAFSPVLDQHRAGASRGTPRDSVVPNVFRLVLCQHEYFDVSLVPILLSRATDSFDTSDSVLALWGLHFLPWEFVTL